MSKVIVALDGMQWNQAIELAKKLSGKVWGFKLNHLLLTASYWTPELSKHGRIMADPKLYDTPKTMKHSVQELVHNGVDFITVHASAGSDSIKAAVEAADKARIVAVTILTSFKPTEIQRIYGTDRPTAVKNLANLAQECGVHGLVCASEDLAVLRDVPLFKVCPAIRPTGYINDDDQVAIGIGKGADYLVCGRPITEAEDPLAVVELMNKG